MNGAGRSLPGVFLVYVVTAVLCGGVGFLVFRLGETDLSVPIYYTQGGDVHFFLANCKTISETGDYHVDPHLGAPGVMDLHDFPLVQTGYLLEMRLIGLFTRDPFVMANLFYLLTYPLAALTCLFVLRRFGVSKSVAVAASLLFAFAPYHLWRGMSHPTLSAYYPIPLAVMVALWLAAGQPIFCRARTGWTVSPRWSRMTAVPTLLTCGLVSISGPYYVVLCSYVMAIGGLIGWLRRRCLARLIDWWLILGLVSTLFLAQCVPYYVHAVRHGSNLRSMYRSQAMVVMLALRLDDMLRPVTGHRLGALRDRELDQPRNGINNIIERYEVRYLETRRCSQLGIIGSAGFLVLLVVGLSWPIRGLRSLLTLRDIAQLNYAVLLLGLNGGVGELISSLSFEKIRAYNRLSIFVSFLSLFALALLVDRLLADRRRGLRFLLPLGLVVALGLLDQTPVVTTPDPEAEAAAFASDRDFVREIEASLPAGSMVFQLPPNSFPAFGGHFTMSDYNLFRGYFHSKALRWSYGAMRGRDVEKWQSSLAPLPPAQLIAQLREKGFAGLYINRRGHVNNATGLEHDLERLLHAKPLVSRDGELSFFSLLR